MVQVVSGPTCTSSHRAKHHSHAYRKDFHISVSTTTFEHCLHHHAQQRELHLGSYGDYAGYGPDTLEATLQILCKQDQLDMAITLLSDLKTAASNKTYFCFLQACNRSNKDLAQAKQIHTHLLHHNTQRNTFLDDYLAMTLANCGLVDEACQIVNTLPHCSVLTWTAIITAYTNCGREQEAISMYQRMQDDGAEANSYTYVSLFKACGNIFDLEMGKKLHEQACRRGFASDVFVGSSLLSMYGKCGAVEEAEAAFAALVHHDIVSWNAMLTAYVQQGEGAKALLFYKQAKEEGVITNRNTLIFALQACSILHDRGDDAGGDVPLTMTLRYIGQALHAGARRRDLISDLMVGSALMTMYGKCGATVDVDNVFSTMNQRDTGSWNALFSAHVEQGNGKYALHFYRQMQEDGMAPDETTFIVAFKACGNMAEMDSEVVEGHSNKEIALELGQALHADADRLGYAINSQLANTLLCMYGKCGAISKAEDVSTRLSCHGIVCCTALFCMYVEEGRAEKALHFYKAMQMQHAPKDENALPSILQACGAAGSVERCREIHFEFVSAGFDNVTAIVLASVIAYRSCAKMLDGQACFDALPKPNVVLWNACMAGHAGEGHHLLSLAMFENMRAMDARPDVSTFVYALSACRHTGLVGIGLAYLDSLSRDYNLTPIDKHYGIFLDLLGRAGNMKKVKDILERMTYLKDDFAIWFSVLGACSTHGNLELAKWAFDYVVRLKPEDATGYVLLSNIYAEVELQNLVVK